jgi:hypothetical protein
VITAFGHGFDVWQRSPTPRAAHKIFSAELCVTQYFVGGETGLWLSLGEAAQATGRRMGRSCMGGKSTDVSSWRNGWLEDVKVPVSWADSGRANSLTKRNVELFEKKNQLRVVMSGHGRRIAGEPKITLPLGMTLYFYVPDGKALENELGRAIEGFTGSGRLPRPVETVKGGTPVWNYCLSWWDDLPINASETEAKYALVTVDERHRNRWIPLSILLRDTRCENAEIHWAACRSVKPAAAG